MTRIIVAAIFQGARVATKNLPHQLPELKKQFPEIANIHPGSINVLLGKPLDNPPQIAGLQIKGPKTERGKRTIEIDDDLAALLLAERERYLRIVAGVPDSAAVDLSLVKLPNNAPARHGADGNSRSRVRAARKRCRVCSC